MVVHCHFVAGEYVGLFLALVCLDIMLSQAIFDRTKMLLIVTLIPNLLLKFLMASNLGLGASGLKCAAFFVEFSIMLDIAVLILAGIIFRYSGKVLSK